MNPFPGYERYPKAERIEKELQLEIADGRHGTVGTPFMTTRELMTYKNVSLKTAHRILGRLCAGGLLEVQGKRYYLKGSVEKRERPVIGLLLTRLDTPYFSNLASHLEEMTRELGAEISIAVSDYNTELERCRLESFCRNGVAGIIACPWGVEENEAVYRDLPVPWVLIGRRLKQTESDAILVDNVKAAQSVAKHLLEAGCEDFLYVGPRNLEDDPRLQGFRLGLLAAGRKLRAEDVFPAEEGMEDDMRSLRNRLSGAEKKTGVFCYHDLYAARVVNLCHEEKLSIPDRVAVAGFDNLPIAAAIYPPLTTVSYPLRDIARMACEILFTRIRCQRVGGGTARYLDSMLIVRESTLPRNRRDGALPVPRASHSESKFSFT